MGIRHEINKAGARNQVRLASAPNGGRSMAHRTIKKGHLLDESELAEGLAEYLARKQTCANRKS